MTPEPTSLFLIKTLNMYVCKYVLSFAPPATCTMRRRLLLLINMTTALALYPPENISTYLSRSRIPLTATAHWMSMYSNWKNRSIYKLPTLTVAKQTTPKQRTQIHISHSIVLPQNLLPNTWLQLYHPVVLSNVICQKYSVGQIILKRYKNTKKYPQHTYYTSNIKDCRKISRNTRTEVCCTQQTVT